MRCTRIPIVYGTSTSLEGCPSTCTYDSNQRILQVRNYTSASPSLPALFFRRLHACLTSPLTWIPVASVRKLSLKALYDWDEWIVDVRNYTSASPSLLALISQRLHACLTSPLTWIPIASVRKLSLKALYDWDEWIVDVRNYTSASPSLLALISQRLHACLTSPLTWIPIASVRKLSLKALYDWDEWIIASSKLKFFAPSLVLPYTTRMPVPQQR